MRTTPRICKPRQAGNGYLRYKLQYGERQRSTPLHHIVLWAFVGPQPDGLEAAHLDGDKTNNAATNLRWVSHAENVSHQIGHGTRLNGEKNHNSKLTAGRVEAIRILADHQMKHRTIAGLFKINEETVGEITRGVTWSHLDRAYATPDATGVLLALVREASGDPMVYCGLYHLPDPCWMVVPDLRYESVLDGGPQFDSEGAALAAALVAIAESI